MQVSILCSHVHHAKKLRDILKQWPVLCYVYTDFEQFWEHSQNELSHLYLLDVEMASGRGQRIIDHPKYRSGQMNVVFYYSQSSLPLMNTAYRMQSLGDLDIEAPDLPQRLSQLWGLFQARLDRKGENSKLKAQLYQAREQLHQVVQKNQHVAKKFDHGQLLGQIIRKIDQLCYGHDFLHALNLAIHHFDCFIQYSILELAPNGQKLVSPRLQGKKYRTFPTLWLGQEHGTRGIQQYAQGLAHQVAVDSLGQDIVAIGARTQAALPPQVLLYLQMEPEVHRHLDWNLFQLFLSGFYGRSLLPEQDGPRESSRLIMPWEFYDLLVDERAMEETPCHLLVLEFQQLAAAITKKRDHDFQWRRFYEKFTTLLDAQIEYDYFATCLGRWGMAFFVSQDHYQKLHTLLIQFSQEFAYWKFFDNPDEILVLNLNPKIKSMKALHQEFFQYMAQRNREDANQYMAQNHEKQTAQQEMAHTFRRTAIEV